jgi:hypothetical protein
VGSLGENTGQVQTTDRRLTRGSRSPAQAAVAQDTLTGTSVIVSLPKMSMTSVWLDLRKVPLQFLRVTFVFYSIQLGRVGFREQEDSIMNVPES